MFNINPKCEDLICKGICKADCCGCVPLLKKDWEDLKNKRNLLKTFELFEFEAKGMMFVLPATQDCKCVFLDFENKCMIYNEKGRPNLCDMYGKSTVEPLLACPHINQGKKGIINNYANNTLMKLQKIRNKGEKWIH